MLFATTEAAYYMYDVDYLTNHTDRATLVAMSEAVEEMISDTLDKNSDAIGDKSFRRLISVSCRLADALECKDLDIVGILRETDEKRAKYLWSLDTEKFSWFKQDLDSFVHDFDHTKWCCLDHDIVATYSMIACIDQCPR